MRQGVYSGKMRLYGTSDEQTLIEAFNYATSLATLKRFKEIKALLRKTLPTARRVLGETYDVTLSMRSVYGEALCRDPGATLDDLRKSVATFEEIERTARRVFGGAHLLTRRIERDLRNARETLRAREKQPSPPPPPESV